MKSPRPCVSSRGAPGGPALPLGQRQPHPTGGAALPRRRRVHALPAGARPASAWCTHRHVAA
eukprot:10411957-Alexandrium_andersonii.AAC.1